MSEGCHRALIGSQLSKSMQLSSANNMNQPSKQRRSPMVRHLVAVLLLTLIHAAQAARPMYTDDARIVEPGACQLESWVRNNPNSTELWALPGCNFTGNLELTLGGSEVREAAGPRNSAIVAQAKTLFKPLTSNGWSWGAAVGVVSDPATGSREVYGYLPMTLSLFDDGTFLHANLGAKREAVTSHKQWTWGLGVEHQVSTRLGLIGETFSQDPGRPFLQLGTRWWVIADRVQIDATVGNRLGSTHGERWFSIGLRLLSPPWLR